MSTQRHILRRFDSGRTDDFDEQFWPVAMAVCILAAFCIGSILTILSGPWMWGSLLAIPILVGLGLLVLSHVEHRFWRRSMQVALLLSLAFHLLVLIIAYRAAFFSGKNPLQVSVQRHITPIPQLEISVRQTEEIWNQPNEIETPQTEVTAERQSATRPTETRPSPNVAAEDSAAQPNPNLQRREQNDSAPQSGQALSQISRHVDPRARQSRELNVESPAAPSAAQPQPSPASEVQPAASARSESRDRQPREVARRQIEPEPRERARTRSAERREESTSQPAVAAARNSRRTSEIVPQPTTSPSRPSRPTRTEAEVENARVEVPAADVAATRRESTPSMTREADNNATTQPTQQRPRRSDIAQIADAMASPDMANRALRQRASRAPDASSTPESETPRARIVESTIQPSPDAAQISRQQTADPQRTSQIRSAAVETLTPTDQMPREVRRRSTDAQRPSDIASSATDPRRARDAAATPTTTTSVEAPGVVAANAEIRPAAMEARPLALQRSTEGVTGSGATPNFGNASDSMATPATVASDSVSRAQAQSTSSESEALSPSQSARVSRSSAGLQASQLSMPNTSNDPSETSAGAQSQPLAASSAAAVTSARASGERSEMSADAGTSDVDIASTKIVSGAARSESAGGGQPELSDAQPATSQASNRNGASDASIVADTNAPTVAAPVTASSGQPANPRANPEATAAVVQRRGGTEALAQGPSRGDTTGDPAEFSSAVESNRELASSPSRRSERGAEGEDSSDDNQPNQTRQATARRQSEIDGPDTVGVPRGLAAQSTATDSDSELEATGSEISRTDRDDSMAAASRTQISTDDGLAGESRNASNSMQRRGEEGPESASDAEAIASAPDRSTRSVELELSSGHEGTDFSRGFAQSGEDTNEEMDPSAIESNRATGTGNESVGPSTRRDEIAATSSAALTSGDARAEGTAGDETDVAATPRRSQRNGASPIDAEGSASLSQPGQPGQGTASAAEQTNDRLAAGRRSEASQANVDIDWEEGIGGLGREPEPDLGVPSRRATSESNVVAAEPKSRFRRREPSGGLATNAQVTIARAPFSGRDPGNLGRSGPQTERAIELGLAFLIRNQKADGHWSLLGFDEEHPSKQMQLDSDTAATGLALLAFQGAGYTHREFKYADRLQRAIAWLVAHQAENGDLYVSSDNVSNASCQLYSHAIAALALAEAYGMTQDPAIREPAQKAIDFIIETQDSKEGGWRYQSIPSLRETDTSVTGWMVMALHSGRLAGLDVDEKVWEGVSDWLETAKAPEGKNQYVYSPNVQDDPNRRIVRSHMRRASNCMTAVGLLMQIYLESDKSNANVIDGASHLLKQLPSEYSMEVRDTYYWYYATQVLRHVDGPAWQTWYNALHPLLVGTQVAEGELAGSWSPYTPVEDKFGRFGGRLYVTTLNLLSLEVDYRLLPLYEDSTVAR